MMSPTKEAGINVLPEYLSYEIVCENLLVSTD